MKAIRTSVDMLRYIEESYANPTAFNWRDQERWHAISTQEFLNTIKFLALGLHQLGVRKGDCVGIMANSSPHWTIADLAIIMAGGVTVPLFANIADENFVYEAKQTNLKIIFIDGDEQVKVFEKHKDLFNLAIVIGNHPSVSKMSTFQAVVELGRELDQRKPHLYAQLQESIQPDDLATIIYTSGSTGVPKGVELTQNNLICEIQFDAFKWNSKKDRYLSVLPLAHVFGHCINWWMLAWGVSIYYTSDYKNLGAICKEVQPTATVVVPRLLEKIFMKMTDKMHSTTGLKRRIGEWGFHLAKKEKLSFFDHLLQPVANLLVYKKLRHALGGSLKAVICGGAPLSPHLQSFFHRIGIFIYEGWGLTEACPVCVNVPAKNKIGTVGPSLPAQEIKINDKQEILVRGSLVMRGYYRDPKTSAATLRDGWLHTGDRGSIDSDGYLTILGRMKELYKTSTGEYVAPVPIEQALCRHSLIDMAMVVAEGRKFVACLLFPNMEMLDRMKTEQKAVHMSNEDFLREPFVKSEMGKLLCEVNQHLNHWEQLHAYQFIMEPLTIQNGELTPSLKIRREIVAKKYRHTIEAMYTEHESKIYDK